MRKSTMIDGQIGEHVSAQRSWKQTWTENYEKIAGFSHF
jgi:hypothetical protein